MEFKTHIEKLKGAVNWSKWKRQIELLLRHNEVLDLVTEDRTLPAELSDAATADLRMKSKLNLFIKMTLWPN